MSAHTCTPHSPYVESQKNFIGWVLSYFYMVSRSMGLQGGHLYLLSHLVCPLVMSCKSVVFIKTKLNLL